MLKWLLKQLKSGLEKFIKNANTVSIIVNSIGVLSMAAIIVAAAEQIGLKQGQGP